MDKKTLILLVASVIAAFILGFGGIWLLLGGQRQEPEAGKPKQTQLEKREQAAETEQASKEAALTSTMDLFQLTMPCQRNAQGDTPIVHADLQLVVPIKHRLKAEENTSRIRDLIATLLRNADIDTIYGDNLVKFKAQVIQEAHDKLGVDIQEILVLRFEYDILKQKH